MEGRKIGEYTWIKDVHAAGQNAAAVTITIFIASTAGGAPYPITMQGSHDFNSGKAWAASARRSFPGCRALLTPPTPRRTR